MTRAAATLGLETKPTRAGLASAVVTGILCAYGLELFRLWHQGHWIVDALGRPALDDFLGFWSAGQLALTGHPAQAYDPAIMHGLQTQIVGHAFKGFYVWAYPPIYFLVALPLAVLPFAWAFFAWISASFAALVAGLRAITPHRTIVMAACAMPFMLGNALAGQNGFLTAALFVAILINLERRPILAGVLLGLLTYKPHFGLLFPMALLAGRHGRAFIAAGVTTAIWLAVCWAIDPATLTAFASHLPSMSNSFLTNASSGWYKMQSLYMLLRIAGAPDSVAFVAQGALALCCAGTTIVLWREQKVAYALKAAWLAAAALIVTPYVYMYDFPILAVAGVFFWQAGQTDRTDKTGLALAILCVTLYALFRLPLGFPAAAILGGLVLRRAFMVPARKDRVLTTAA